MSECQKYRFPLDSLKWEHFSHCIMDGKWYALVLSDTRDWVLHAHEHMHKYFNRGSLSRDFLIPCIFSIMPSPLLIQRINLCQPDTHNHRTHLKSPLRWLFDCDNARTSIIALPAWGNYVKQMKRVGFSLRFCQTAKLNFKWTLCIVLSSYLLQPKLFFFFF